eukprot:TRINITY_DN5677_c0_g1_i1.p1 TRINITY_DN5677_c0_g1~~TRINITY_DN5677_c0_g1_i1.p1  ORF type:complete len:776 (-),score=234.71 TRINITY_DN5677_c0_g1_i1:396-2723(-)
MALVAIDPVGAPKRARNLLEECGMASAVEPGTKRRNAGDVGQGVGGKSELLNVLGEVKARVQDKLRIEGLPMPQFILIGAQSVGKSRCIEALAGETFNFTSGTLGSRRPTVLEFRNVAAYRTSKWYLRDKATQEWNEMSVAMIMEEVGRAHEELGETISHEPVHVRIESATCVDMQIVDLPGFRDFAFDDTKKQLSIKIQGLVESFMKDPNNMMLCVEQAGDASTMATLQKCKKFDPDFKRTILMRNKLDKFYKDLTGSNVNEWLQGYSDLPSDMTRPYRFAFTLPHWEDGKACPKPFVEMRNSQSQHDINTMRQKGLTEANLKLIGLNNFVAHMESVIERRFGESIGPVMGSLMKLRGSSVKEYKSLQEEWQETDPQKILSTARDCGISFATALTHVMEGVLDLTPVLNLEDELKAFHERYKDAKAFPLLPSENFKNLDEYLTFLRDEMQIATYDVELNGGAQFRRLMQEVETFLRFSELAVETTKKDVIQARGVSMSSVTWKDVVVKLLNNGAHMPLQGRVAYVGERIKWFFEQQKEPVLAFMAGLEGTPSAKLYSPLYPKHAKLILQNATIKQLVFQTYDDKCQEQLQHFVELFDNMLTSTFSNPWVFLKGSGRTAGSGAAPQGGGDSSKAAGGIVSSFEEAKQRLPAELASRSSIDAQLCRWLQDIPTESNQIDEAVDRVQMLVQKTYSFIRSQVCDQVELFSESFFKLPMLRRLEQDMAVSELNTEQTREFLNNRDRLTAKRDHAFASVKEIEDSITLLQQFKSRSEARH